MAKRKSKKLSTKDDAAEWSFMNSCLFRLLNGVPAAFVILLIIYIWSSFTTIISGSMVHVCVTSRKLNNLYCLSAGTQPTNYDHPFPSISNNSKISVVETNNKPANETTKLPVFLPNKSLSIASQNTKTLASELPAFSSNNSPSIASQNAKTSASELPALSSNNSPSIASQNTKISASELPAFSHNNSPSIASQNTTTSVSEEKTEEIIKNTINSTVSSTTIPSEIPHSVLRESLGIHLPTSSKSETNQLSDGITEQVSSFTKLAILKGVDKAKLKETVNARKDVEEQLSILRTFIAKSKAYDCEKRGIYVYELPPMFNKDLLVMCDEMMTGVEFCKYLTNDAMGEAIPELGKGWYNTHQYSLEPLFHNRILNHPCRVHNPEDAKLFYVPFYGGFDVLRWHFKKVPNDVKDEFSKELVEWLDKKWMWKRNFGLDHVFVLGKISWDFRRPENGSWGSQLLELDELQNPMKLLIERQPWQINDVGIPHPSYFHPSSDDDIIAWQEKIRQVQRKYLISFAGAPRKASKIRSILIEQCTSSPRDCNFLNCADKACLKSAPIVKLFMESEFCLQPPGDSSTRKSVFDSLIAGCIPVIFDPFTAYYQYPWHFPADHRKYSVFIDQEEVKASEVNIVEQLVKIPLNQRQKMREYIIDELMPKLVYAQANSKLEKFEDAFTISVNNLLQRAVSRLP